MKAFIGRLLAKLPRNRAGFTLVEMLVVVAIIVALAAVIVPTVTILLDQGEEGAKDAELQALQTAVDSMMVGEGLTSVVPSNEVDGGPTFRDFRTVDFNPDAAETLLTLYMRDDVTQFCYTWDGDGKIASQADPAGTVDAIEADGVLYQAC